MPPVRGKFLDYFGNIIAGNLKVYQLHVIPEEVEDFRYLMVRLKEIYSTEEFEKIIKKKNKQKSWETLIISKNLTWEQFTKVNYFLHDLVGAKPVLSVSRNYPFDENYTHVLGYVSEASEKDILNNETIKNKHVPGLKVAKHHGTKRAKEPVVLEEVDIVVTSYGTLRQDIEMLSTMEWSVVIGDEAQHIKNRRSQNAKSLTRLHSKGRFLLTGTPVENSLDDLLSLFAFLMPGYVTKATGKLSQEEREWHSRRQTQRAAAYILRRTKKEVAPELPDKIEKTFFCELGAKQMRFYNDTLEKTRREISNLEMAGANAGRVQFAAFTELLRLRQACVDPRIIDDTFPAADSAKLAAFDEVLDECIDAGSRILVFSSFVTALKLLAQHLTEKGHKFCYLDGKTKNRLAMCDTFNEDESIPVFLISLKAGGTGLNLTGADTVVHYDPWWNPAAEAQATDRAHRIGQERVVTSIKLIAANTVEEKVIELQAKKAEILKELFEESEAANAKVSLEDIKGLLA